MAAAGGPGRGGGREKAAGRAAVVLPAATRRRCLGFGALLRVCVSFVLVISFRCGAVPRSQLLLLACFLLEKLKRGV